MSLKTFHIVFVTLSALMCAGIAVWKISSGEPGSLVQGLAAAAAAIALVVYGVRFLKKFKELSFL
ncbi:MAG: hypothetical protein VCA74_07050 [Deltaproteobacteria bacterium]|jgi:membrane protein implicated in regulation of membrane protease activity